MLGHPVFMLMYVYVSKAAADATISSSTSRHLDLHVSLSCFLLTPPISHVRYGCCLQCPNSLTLEIISECSVTGQLADTPTRGLDDSRTGQLADATGDFACLVFVLLAASAIPRVVQLPNVRKSYSSQCHIDVRTKLPHHVVVVRHPIIRSTTEKSYNRH